ncbi:PH domain-containing protein [Aurantiacibacter spongiae]|uniref:YdbS-like PH domain-containing protein n=1 Tax=Aurantiacibacter spongiae TaxID=2488860 RepID=A0A3N5DQ87_9SPHN|nr:PH domain-containing protein [Aurantiacibacter spongiae]RPF71321.1 hypothetical protein EG799_06640 [Aurantiacibacter spongiae]
MHDLIADDAFARPGRDDGYGELTKLDPGYATVLRIRGALILLPLIAGGVGLSVAGDLPPLVPVLLLIFIAAILLIYLPMRRYAARGYDMGEDRLQVVKGVMFRSDTVVPFSRVQHLDVEQGPLERAFGIARLILHTAGTHNSSVTLPGLAHVDAVAMREAIRRHVKRESL